MSRHLSSSSTRRSPSRRSTDPPVARGGVPRSAGVVGAVVALVLSVLVTVAAPASASPSSAPSSGSSASGPSATESDTWLSGASGTGVASGAFGAWRGTPVDIAGTWADNETAQVELWQLQPGGEYDDWTKSIDIAIGAISEDESWAQAADGAYDDRWRESLTNLESLWGSRPGTVYLRFAHEMNSNWYPWSVGEGEVQDFTAAWKRFRALQQEIFPASQLVFCVNRESVGTGIDWRTTFPGRQYVDVMSVDYYNQYPYVDSWSEWWASARQTDSTGAPKGLQAHLDFARSVGLPLAVSEWSGKASQGDSPVFVRAMHAFFAAHAGTGAGELLYEVQFNVDMNDDDYRLFGGGQMPRSASAYRAAF